MKKPTRSRPRYASRYESLRPFLRFLAWGCWHKSEFAMSSRSYEEGLNRASVFLPDKALRKTFKGHRRYITLRGDAYYGCNNFLVNSYRMKSLPPYQTFYTVALLQLLGIPGIQLSFEKIVNARLWEGVFPAAFEEKFRRKQDAKNKKKQENRADSFDDEMDDESVTVDENQIHDVLRYLQKAGYVRKFRKAGKDRYCLVQNPLEGLGHHEVDILLAAIGFYKNVSAVSVIGYQIEEILQNLYRREKLPAIPAQFRSIAFDRVLDDEILYAALEAIRQKKSLRFLYKGKARLVFPLRVITDFASGGRQYLEGIEKDVSYIGSYRLDRITDIRLVKAERPADPPAPPQSIRLVVRFHLADGDKEALRARILNHSPKISLLSEEKDTLLCAVDDPQPLRFFPWLRSFMPRVEILAGPDGLRERMRTHIKEALGNYGYPVQ